MSDSRVGRDFMSPFALTLANGSSEDRPCSPARLLGATKTAHGGGPAIATHAAAAPSYCIGQAQQPNGILNRHLLNSSPYMSRCCRCCISRPRSCRYPSEHPALSRPGVCMHVSASSNTPRPWMPRPCSDCAQHGRDDGGTNASINEARIACKGRNWSARHALCTMQAHAVQARCCGQAVA